jgi:hypothetical protein
VASLQSLATVSFFALVASNQFAFWIEDMDGYYVDVLYVTRYTSPEGYGQRPNSRVYFFVVHKVVKCKQIFRQGKRFSMLEGFLPILLAHKSIF